MTSRPTPRSPGDGDGGGSGDVAGHDPVRERRARFGRWARAGKRAGYSLFAVAIAAFTTGAVGEFTPAIVEGGGGSPGRGLGRAGPVDRHRLRRERRRPRRAPPPGATGPALSPAPARPRKARMTTAAVLAALDHHLEIRHDVEVEAPRAGEVKVRIAAAGRVPLRPVDAERHPPHPAARGPRPRGGGRGRGGGRRRGSTSPGDHVVLAWVPQCRRCWYCCRGPAPAVPAGRRRPAHRRPPRRHSPPPPRRRGRCSRCSASAPSRETDGRAGRRRRSRPARPRPRHRRPAGLRGAHRRGRRPEHRHIGPGDTVAVVGCGGVGLNVVQGARIAGAAQIVAVDATPAKLDLATELGATHVVDAVALRPGVGGDGPHRRAGRGRGLRGGGPPGHHPPRP